jgi:predicted dehydrogenase
MTERPMKVGIVGAGNIAARHAQAYRELAEIGAVEVVGVADLALDRAEALARTLPGARAYASLGDMLRQAGPDGVSVCAPNAFHREIAVEALEAGAHVLCEKPPAINAVQAEEMAALAAARERVLLYGLLYRHMVPARPFVEELGRIYHAEAVWLRRRGIPGWGIYTDKEMQGGGAFIDLGVHVLDLAWSLMGCPRPMRIGGTTFAHIGRTSQVGLLGPWDRERFGVEDTAVGAVMFEGETRLEIHAAFAANIPVNEQVYVGLNGDRGALKIPLMTSQEVATEAFRPTIYTERHGHLIDMSISEPLPPTVAQGFRLQAEHFVRCCVDGEQPIVTPEQGTVLQRMIDGFYASAGSTDRVVLADE